MQAFRDVLDVCELHDLGFKGVPCTYDNKREGHNNVRVRLDRAVTDNNWREMFSNAQVEHLVSPCSDLVTLRFSVSNDQQIRRKCLHYEIFRERETELTKVIDDSWDSSGEKSDLADISRALRRVMLDLHSWSRKKCKNVGREIEKGRKELAELIATNADSRLIQKATDTLHELLYREEMLWLQRSRINWLKEGDRNAKFFHSKVVWRAKKNRITKLQDSAGTVHSTTTVLEDMATEYFKTVFTADPLLDQSKVTRLVQGKVTAEMTERLCAEFSEEEISNAVFQIGPIKAPGPDGFPSRFYQHNWGVLKTDIVRAVKQFFVSGVMCHALKIA